MINMKAQLATLLSKEMDRKDFLKHLAAAGFMVAGGGMLLQSVGGLNKHAEGKQASESKVGAVGYGASVYGGRPAVS